MLLRHTVFSVMKDIFCHKFTFVKYQEPNILFQFLHLEKNRSRLAFRYISVEYTYYDLYRHYQETHPELKVSRTLYMDVIKLNIRPSRLGNEDCERCDSFKIHGGCEETDCKICKNFHGHRQNHTTAHTKYGEDQELAKRGEKLIFSGDLQKTLHTGLVMEVEEKDLP